MVSLGLVAVQGVLKQGHPNSYLICGKTVNMYRLRIVCNKKGLVILFPGKDTIIKFEFGFPFFVDSIKGA